MKLEKFGKKFFDMVKSNPLNCPHCNGSIKSSLLEKQFYICPICMKYIKMPALDRIKLVLDEYQIISKEPKVLNPIDFPSYEKKQSELREKSSIKEAVLVAEGKIRDERIVVCAMDSQYLMGSMGVYVGEEITNAFYYAIRNKLPILIFCASGGARMQEGIFSLMQMAKTSIAVNEHSDNKLLYISCMTNPTTGGVLASFASLADIIIAEPDAHIGFAGPRVIKSTISQELPEGFQSSHFLLEHGFLDDIVSRNEIKGYIYKLLKLHKDNYSIDS